MEICKKPWGWYKVLSDDDQCKVKLIMVESKARLSLQSHTQRREHWYVVEGTLTVERGKDPTSISTINCYALSSVEIERNELHRASNESNSPVLFVEVQTGDYFGEDDITRYEDDYGRT